MRICVSGTTNVGKSNFIDRFLTKYNNYSTPKTSFSDVIEAIFIKTKQDGRETSSRDIQSNILTYMTQEVSSYSKDDDIIINGCVLDNIIHSLYVLEKLPYDVSGIDADFIDTCVPHVREATKNIDIIFLLTSNTSMTS